MKKYCLDTSGLSTAIQHMPEDIHVSLWRTIQSKIEIGLFAATKEIYDELERIEGSLGNCIRNNKEHILYDIGDARWNWRQYIAIATRMQSQYADFISEYNNNRKGTVGLNDISIIAMAKCLSLPVISMEISTIQSPRLRRIPDICNLESVTHLYFNEFLRAENIKI